MLGRKRIGFVVSGLVALSGALVLSSFSTANAGTRLLMVSDHSDRSNFRAVSGSTMTGDEYIFVTNLPSHTTKVTFFLDKNEVPVSIEQVIPFDFATTAPDMSARPYDVSKLSAGKHTISYILEYQGKSVLNKATFTVKSAAAPTTSTTVKPTTKPTTTTVAPPTTTSTTAPKPTTTTTAKPPVTTTTVPPVTTTSVPTSTVSNLSLPTTGTASLGSGTFVFSNFNNSTNFGGTMPTGGLTGAGVGKTIIEMKANTSTHASQVPTAVGSTTNPFYLLGINAGSPTISGFTLQGTSQGHLYGGIAMRTPTNAKISNIKIASIPGNFHVNPGETFSIAENHGTNSTYSNIEVDGAGIGASGIGINSANGVTITDSYLHDLKYSAGIALWQTKNGTINNVRSDRNYTGINLERTTGTVTINKPEISGSLSQDMFIGTEGASAVVNINDPILAAGKKLNIRVPVTYMGTNCTQKKSDIHVFVNGVDKTSSLVNWL